MTATPNLATLLELQATVPDVATVVTNGTTIATSLSYPKAPVFATPDEQKLAQIIYSSERVSQNALITCGFPPARE